MFPNYEKKTFTTEPREVVYWFDAENGYVHLRAGGQHVKNRATPSTSEAVAKELLANHLIQPREEAAQ